jgi:hypothetical protein
MASAWGLSWGVAWGDAWGSVSLTPDLLGPIPNLFAGLDSGTRTFGLGTYFSGGTSYAIDPAVEAGWSFNTSTAQLDVETDVEGTFGPYTITATNAEGDTESNAFSVIVFDSESRMVKMGISTGLRL